MKRNQLAEQLAEQQNTKGSLQDKEIQLSAVLHYAEISKPSLEDMIYHQIGANI